MKKKFKNIFLSASGQFFLILAAPVLARIYTPAQLGVYGELLSISTIIGINSAMKFDVLLVSISKKNKVFEIFYLALFLGIVNTIVLSILIACFKFESNLEIVMLVFLSLSSMLFQVYTYLNTRLNKMSRVAQSRAIRGGVTGISQIAFGLLTPKAIMLSLSSVIGNLIYISVFYFYIFKSLNFLKKMRANKLKRIFFENCSFSMYSLPQGLLNSLSSNLPVIYLGYNEQYHLLGYYVMAERLVRSPVNFINISIRQFFLNDIMISHSKARTYFNWFLPLFFVAIAFYAFLYFYSFPIIDFFLGENWLNASEIVVIILPWLTLSLLQVPASGVIVFYRKSKGYAIIEFIDFVIKVFVLFYFSTGLGFYTGIQYFVVVGFCSYIGVIIYSFFVLRQSSV